MSRLQAWLAAAQTTQAQKIRSFVLGYLHALGAQLNEEGPLLRVELTPEQLAEVEGRSGPRWGIYGLAEESTNSVIYLAFHPGDARADPRAELIAPGSHRLEQMIASAMRQGRLSRFTMLPAGQRAPGAELYHTCLLVHMRVTLEGRYPQEQLIAAGIDLTAGRLRQELLRQAETALFSDMVPEQVAKRALSVAAGLELAVRYTATTLGQQDDGWAREALLALAAERRILQQYYVQDGSADRVEQALRLAELERRCRPRAIVRPVLCALVFVPAEISH